MFRITAALALLLFAFSAEAWAQLIVRPHAPRPVIARPAGVIQPPALGFAGALTPPSPVAPARVLPRPFLTANPFFGAWPYGGYWPGYVDPFAYDDPSYYAPLTPPPAPKPPPISAPVSEPPTPPDFRARLTLTVPPGAVVTVGGQEVDSAASPILLESPDLREGQRYAFDVKVTWKAGDKVEERGRVVNVDAGDTKSLTYAR